MAGQVIGFPNIQRRECPNSRLLRCRVCLSGRSCSQSEFPRPPQLRMRRASLGVDAASRRARRFAESALTGGPWVCSTVEPGRHDMSNEKPNVAEIPMLSPCNAATQRRAGSRLNAAGESKPGTWCWWSHASTSGQTCSVEASRPHLTRLAVFCMKHPLREPGSHACSISGCNSGSLGRNETRTEDIR